MSILATDRDVMLVLYDTFNPANGNLLEYWISYSGQSNNKVTNLSFYTYPNENMKKNIEKAKSILNEIVTPQMSKRERLKAIHDYLAANVEYDYEKLIKNKEAAELYSAYGALIDGKTVCDGYTKAFWLLSLLAGVETNRVHGTVGDVWHAWNVTNFGGIDYHIDVTWDSYGEGQFGDHYFMLDRENTLKAGDRQLCGEINTSSGLMADNEAEPDTYEKACRLRVLNLYYNSIFDEGLKRIPTRLEGAILFVRLLGKEAEVLKGEYSHPFDDVPAWANKYIGYLFKENLIKGTSDKSYSPSKRLEMEEYFKYMLYALDYSNIILEDNNKVKEQVVRYGIFTEEEIESVYSSDFTVGSLVETTYNTLLTKCENSDDILLEKLMNSDKAIDNMQLLSSGIVLE